MYLKEKQRQTLQDSIIKLFVNYDLNFNKQKPPLINWEQNPHKKYKLTFESYT
jgi:hypothetical protein